MFTTFRKGRPFEVPIAEVVQPPADEPVAIGLVLYAEDCTISGHLLSAAERLSDHLNGQESIELLDGIVEDFAGGPPIEVHSVAVARDEIMLIRASSPRGNPERRQHTSQHAIVLQVGRYEVHGYVHTLPGGDPISSVRRRKPMIPLTDAFITFSRHSRVQVHHAGVLIVNRDLVDSISEGENELVAMPQMPVDFTGLLLKDFTGHLMDAGLGY